jgi:hypothetical protein
MEYSPGHKDSETSAGQLVSKAELFSSEQLEISFSTIVEKIDHNV